MIHNESKFYNLLRPVNLIVAISILVNAIFLSKWLYREYQAKNTPQLGAITYANNREAIYKQLPIFNDDIVFIGDSHTQFYDVEEFFHNTKIKNRGIYADHTAGVLYRLPHILKSHPYKIFIQIGINDFGLKGLSADSALNNYKRILSEIKKESPRTKIYVESIFPTVKANPDTINKYNKGLRLLAQTNGAHFIDLYNAFAQGTALAQNYDSGDGIHLNAEGYYLWTNILQPFID